MMTKRDLITRRELLQRLALLTGSDVRALARPGRGGAGDLR